MSKKVFSIIIILIGGLLSSCFASLDPPSEASLKSSNPTLRITIAGATGSTPLLIRLSHGNKLQHFGAPSFYTTGPTGTELRFNLAANSENVTVGVFLDVDEDGNVSAGDQGYYESGIGFDESTAGNEFGTNNHQVAAISLTSDDFSTVTPIVWGAMTTDSLAEHRCYLDVTGNELFTSEALPTKQTGSNWFWYGEFTTDSTTTTVNTNGQFLPDETNYDVLCVTAGVKTKFTDVDFSSAVVLEL